MGTVDSLPADQRAVLQLVLQRGRSYEDIAGVLHMDPAAVRRRALAALDALAPQPGPAEDRRAAIGDYLLVQLPEDERAALRADLARSAAEREWARAVSAQLAPLAVYGLPPVPAGDQAEAGSGSRGAGPSPSPGGPSQPPGSRAIGARRGGAAVTALTTIVIAAALIILLVTRGSVAPRRTAAHPRTSAASTSTTTSRTSSTAATVLGQINLTPSSSSSKAVGVADVIREGSGDGVAIVAQNVPPNTTNPPNAYAAWLYNSPRDAAFLGFVNPGVGANGRLSTAGPLPANHARYRLLIITLETSSKPKRPGQPILQGRLNGL